MPDQSTATDELLAIRRQEENLAQARHAVTRRQVREQERLLVATRQSRLCAVARLRSADDHRIGHEDAGDIVVRCDAAVANARKRLDLLRALEEDEQRDLAAAKGRLRAAEAGSRRQVVLISRDGYTIEGRKAA